MFTVVSRVCTDYSGDTEITGTNSWLSHSDPDCCAACRAHDNAHVYRSVIFANFVVMFSFKLMYGIFYGIYRLLLLVIRRHDALL